MKGRLVKPLEDEAFTFGQFNAVERGEDYRVDGVDVEQETERN